MKYQVIYTNYDNQECKTTIDVPDHIPYYDPTDTEDVPLYINQHIEDLMCLEDYTKLETA